MACFEAGTIIELDSREAVTLRDVRGSTLRVTRGTVWLTQENDPSDVILRVGDNWVVEREGATVIEAQDAVILCVVGRHVEPTVEPANEPEFDGWRARLANLFSLVPRRPIPYV
jgi:hypothetical protein